MFVAKAVRKLSLLAGLMVLAAFSQAFFLQDPKIVIDRAIDSPTLTVRYSGAKVALIEVRVNGASVATRQMNGEQKGETNFTLDLAVLREGENKVVIRLFDTTGKLLGTQETSILADAAQSGPASIEAPKAGATVQGPVEIKLGLKQNLRNIYVSFFINEEFKALRNVPPFTYMWDTTGVSNGWHELEAWVVDDNNLSFKTRKVRVFVNNPGGRTERNTAPTTVNLDTSSNTVSPGVAGSGSGLRTGSGASGQASGTVAGEAQMPRDVRTITPSRVVGAPAQANGTKPAPIAPGVPTGPRDLTPSGTRRTVETTQPPVTVATNQQAGTSGVSVVAESQRVSAEVQKVAIGYGTRIPQIGSYTILLNDRIVNFDVTPAAEDGVPLTPFRHLLEEAGGEVKWEHLSKTVNALVPGTEITLQIGNPFAKVNSENVQLEKSPFIKNGRTIVPLSFIGQSLKVDVNYDPATGHVLITNKKD